MQDLNAAIQAVKSTGDPSPVLLGGPLYTRTPSEFLLKTPKEISSVALKAFLKIALLTLAILPGPMSFPPVQESWWPCPKGRVLGLS